MATRSGSICLFDPDFFLTLPFAAFPAQCEVAYPWCTWGRRNLDEDAVTVPSNTALADRILSVGDDVSAEVKKLLEACESEKHTVITKLRQGVDGVSESCNKLLQEHIDFICFKL